MFLKIHTHTNYLSCQCVFVCALNSLSIYVCVYVFMVYVFTVYGPQQQGWTSIFPPPLTTLLIYVVRDRSVYMCTFHTHTQTHAHIGTHMHTNTHICQWQTAPFNTLTLELSLCGSASQRLNRFTALRSSCTENPQNATVESSEHLGQRGSENHIVLLIMDEVNTWVESTYAIML